MTPEAVVTPGSLWLIGLLVSLAIILAQALKIAVDRRWPSKNAGQNGSCRFDYEALDRLQAVYRMSKDLADAVKGPQGTVVVNARMIRDLDSIAKRLEGIATIQNHTINLLERLVDRIPTQAAK